MSGWRNPYGWGEIAVVNGVTTNAVEDAVDASGVIAIQHHGEKGQTYDFCNLAIR